MRCENRLSVLCSCYIAYACAPCRYREGNGSIHGDAYHQVLISPPVHTVDSALFRNLCRYLNSLERLSEKILEFQLFAYGHSYSESEQIVEAASEYTSAILETATECLKVAYVDRGSRGGRDIYRYVFS